MTINFLGFKRRFRNDVGDVILRNFRYVSPDGDPRWMWLISFDPKGIDPKHERIGRQVWESYWINKKGPPYLGLFYVGEGGETCGFEGYENNSKVFGAPANIFGRALWFKPSSPAVTILLLRYEDGATERITVDLPKYRAAAEKTAQVS